MYSIGFHEIVRQVSVSCIERGQLLAKVWAGYMALFEQLERLQHPLRDDIRLLREKVAEQVGSSSSSSSSSSELRLGTHCHVLIAHVWVCAGERPPRRRRQGDGP